MKDLEEKIKKLSILYSVTANIGAAISADEVLKIVLDETVDFLKIELGAILLFDKEKKLFFIKEKIGLLKEGIIGSKEWPISEIIKNEKPIIKTIHKKIPIFVPYEPKTIIVFPVKIKGEIGAILLLGKILPSRISKEEKWLLTIMVNRLGVALEIAELYKELKETRNELVEKERFAILARIAQEAAHEIRNPLNVIKAGIYLLNKRFEEDKWVKDKVFKMDEAVSRVGRYIEDLLGFSKLPLFEIKDVDINSIINEALREFGIDKLLGIEIIENLSKIPKIKGDSDRLKDVLVNLIRNASEACNGKGRIKFTTRFSGSDVEIEVSDTGCGISEDKIKEIFNPFFTTKKKGTGLGLAITKRIIEAHNGEIKVESKPECGTKFIISLPQ